MRTSLEARCGGGEDGSGGGGCGGSGSGGANGGGSAPWPQAPRKASMSSIGTQSATQRRGLSEQPAEQEQEQQEQTQQLPQHQQQQHQQQQGELRSEEGSEEQQQRVRDNGSEWRMLPRAMWRRAAAHLLVGDAASFREACRHLRENSPLGGVRRAAAHDVLAVEGCDGTWAASGRPPVVGWPAGCGGQGAHPGRDDRGMCAGSGSRGARSFSGVEDARISSGIQDTRADSGRSLPTPPPVWARWLAVLRLHVAQPAHALLADGRAGTPEFAAVLGRLELLDGRDNGGGRDGGEDGAGDAPQKNGNNGSGNGGCGRSSFGDGGGGSDQSGFGDGSGGGGRSSFGDGGGRSSFGDGHGGGRSSFGDGGRSSFDDGGQSSFGSGGRSSFGNSQTFSGGRGGGGSRRCELMSPDSGSWASACAPSPRPRHSLHCKADDAPAARRSAFDFPAAQACTAAPRSPPLPVHAAASPREYVSGGAAGRATLHGRLPPPFSGSFDQLYRLLRAYNSAVGSPGGQQRAPNGAFAVAPHQHGPLRPAHAGSAAQPPAAHADGTAQPNDMHVAHAGAPGPQAWGRAAPADSLGLLGRMPSARAGFLGPLDRMHMNAAPASAPNLPDRMHVPDLMSPKLALRTPGSSSRKLGLHPPGLSSPNLGMHSPRSSSPKPGLHSPGLSPKIGLHEQLQLQDYVQLTRATASSPSGGPLLAGLLDGRSSWTGSKVGAECDDDALRCAAGECGGGAWAAAAANGQTASRHAAYGCTSAGGNTPDGAPGNDDEACGGSVGAARAGCAACMRALGGRAFAGRNAAAGDEVCAADAALTRTDYEAGGRAPCNGSTGEERTASALGRTLTR